MAHKILTNEEVCAALLANGTIKEASRVLCVSEKTVYTMMESEDFKKMYGYAQADILSASVIACQDKMTEAINCIAEIMNDKEVNPQTRLQAAQTMLKTGIKLYQSKKGLQNSAEMCM